MTVGPLSNMLDKGEPMLQSSKPIKMMQQHIGTLPSMDLQPMLQSSPLHGVEYIVQIKYLGTSSAEEQETVAHSCI
ncbi:hypothetical protein C5167_042667 [Papaver somniferum]|uniref:Uncharacterized protein n=1 Tax=Papaver somniferum TaxID=3469 RepID=A0A4Y7L3F9_PAPSO|nr:hypothetical protein C5167_042667 [Papaver somniferum]